MTSQNFILIEYEKYHKHEWFYDAEANVTYQNNRMGDQDNWHINSVQPRALTQEECMVLTHKRFELITRQNTKNAMNQLKIFYDRRIIYIPTDLLQKIHYYSCEACALNLAPLKSNDAIGKMRNYIVAGRYGGYYIGGIQYRANIRRQYNVNGPNNALWYGFDIFNNSYSGDRYMPFIFQVLIENSYSGLWQN